MKKRLIVFGAILLALLLTGAATIEITARITTPVVTDADSLIQIFLTQRASFPPIPSPVPYTDVVDQLAEGRADFLSAPQWTYAHDFGALALSKKSKLKLQTPMRLVAYEDLVSGKLVLLGTPEGSKESQTLAIVDAPAFSAYDGKMLLGSYLTKEFWPRRVI